MADESTGGNRRVAAAVPPRIAIESRYKEMSEIYNMTIVSEVATALRASIAAIEVEYFSMNEETMFVMSDEVTETRKTYDTRLLINCHHDFSRYAIFPFKHKKLKLPDGQTCDVAVPYEPLTWTAEREYDQETGQFNTYLYDRHSGDEITLWVQSENNTGPNWFNSGFNSECGTLHPCYKRLIRILTECDNLATQEISPSVLIQENPSLSPAERQHTILEEVHELLNAKRMEDGTRADEPTIELERGNGINRVPKGHVVAGVQLRGQNFHKIEQEIDWFNSKVIAAIGVSKNLFSRHTKTDGSQMNQHMSEAAALDEKHRLHDTAMAKARDLVQAMKDIHWQLTGRIVKPQLGIKGSITTQMVDYLAMNKAIDPITANEHRLRIARMDVNHASMRNTRYKVLKKESKELKKKEKKPTKEEMVTSDDTKLGVEGIENRNREKIREEQKQDKVDSKPKSKKKKKEDDEEEEEDSEEEPKKNKKEKDKDDEEEPKKKDEEEPKKKKEDDEKPKAKKQKTSSDDSDSDDDDEEKEKKKKKKNPVTKEKTAT